MRPFEAIPELDVAVTQAQQLKKRYRAEVVKRERDLRTNAEQKRGKVEEVRIELVGGDEKRQNRGREMGGIQTAERLFDEDMAVVEREEKAGADPVLVEQMRRVAESHLEDNIKRIMDEMERIIKKVN